MEARQQLIEIKLEQLSAIINAYQALDRANRINSRGGTIHGLAFLVLSPLSSLVRHHSSVSTSINELLFQVRALAGRVPGLETGTDKLKAENITLKIKAFRGSSWEELTIHRTPFSCQVKAAERVEF